MATGGTVSTPRYLTVGGPDLLLQEEAAIGGPISDNIRARVAVQKIDRDGYGINEFTGNDIDDADQPALVVEGTETQSELSFVKAVGCHEAQSYFYSKPLPAPMRSAFAMATPASSFGLNAGRLDQLHPLRLVLAHAPGHLLLTHGLQIG